MSKLIVEEVTTPDTNTDLTINPNGTGKTVIDGTLDMNGGELILDADADTSITADTDDRIDFKVGGSDGMHLTATGLGVGTSTVDSALHIEQNASGVTETSGSTLKIHNTNSSGRSKITVHNSAETASGSVYYDTDSGSLALQGDTGANVTIHTNGNNERMRISSAGDVGIGTASPTNLLQLDVGSATKACIRAYNSSTNGYYGTVLTCHTNNGYAVLFQRGSTSVGSIFAGTSSTSYNTSSDYRLKESVVDMTGAIARVKQLAPKRFNFINDPDDTTVDGFLAHEAQTVVPEAVTGTHNEVDDNGDAVMQGIDQSKLVPLLTGALKEAIAKIETLETRVAALEANDVDFKGSRNSAHERDVCADD